MKKYVFGLILAILISIPAYCLEFDTSVDAEIRKKYDSNRLNEQVLPSLPKVSPSSPSKTSSPVVKSVSPHHSISVSKEECTVKIPSGTKFQVKSNTKIADWMKSGTQVSFTTTSTVTKRNYSIPAGTILTGEILKSHSPQITGNGGLVIVKINDIRINNNYYAAEGKVIKAGGKKIFFNRIKGKRLYLSSVKSQIDKGEKFYQKTRTLSSKLSNNPIGYFLSPFPTIFGIGGYAVCTVISPISAIFKKGKNSAFSEGSIFELKLTNPVYIK